MDFRGSMRVESTTRWVPYATCAEAAWRIGGVNTMLSIMNTTGTNKRNRSPMVHPLRYGIMQALSRAPGICLLLATLVLMNSVASAQTEPPHAQLRTVAPGAIAIDWEHPNDGATGITLEREEPAFTWVFAALVNSFNDLGLQPGRIYRYRVCAIYGETSVCTPWLSAKTFDTPPPPPNPGSPVFTSSSSSTNSITVNWSSAPSYSFHQVRWAENGHGDGQNRVNGRSFTVNGLRPGTYHFIVQGCNRTLLGSSCSRFSAPVFVATQTPLPPPPPVRPAKGVIYSITLNDDLMWYRHTGREDGSFQWTSNEGRIVGTGWNFKEVFSGGDGFLYAITPVVPATFPTGIGPGMGGHPASGGDLMWYHHTGKEDGSFQWAFAEGKKVGVGWGGFKQIFSGGDGIIYAVTESGDLMWYRHTGRQDGSFRWAFNEGKKVGVGWQFKQIFSGGNGIIYAVTDSGDLMWYRHTGREDGSFTWAFNEGKKVGNGWNFQQIFSGGDGVIYVTNDSGELLWYRHTGFEDGTFRWAFNEGKKVGSGWFRFAVKHAFSE